MSRLERLTPDEKALLIALPYRVGLWVSESDTTGGAHSDTQELEAFEIMIAGYSEDFLKSEFVEEMLNATIKNRAKWPEWSQNLDSVPKECEKALGIAQNYLSSDEIDSFRKNLMEIARTVALAYREIDLEDMGVFDVMKVKFSYRLACFMARMKKQPEPTFDQFLNISDDERKALNQLSSILDVDFNGNPVKNAAAA